MKRNLIFLLLTWCTDFQSYGQQQLYQVMLDGHRAGSFIYEVRYDEAFLTSTTLILEIRTLQDTIRYANHSHITESYQGLITNIEWTKVLVDSTTHQIEVRGDSLFKIELDQQQRFVSKTPMLFGPERIKEISTSILDSIGAQLCLWTYSTVLNKPVTLKREVMGYEIVDAQKLTIINETIDNGNSTIKHFDKNFNLIRSKQQSPFGLIQINKVTRLKSPQFFESTFFNQRLIPSNILIPDPKQIEFIIMQVSGLDSICAQNISGMNQLRLPDVDQTYRYKLTQSALPALSSDSAYLEPNELILSHLNVESIVDSLSEGLSPANRLTQLIRFAQSKGRYAVPLFTQLAITAGIPARMVYGYTYNQWYWLPGYWAEVIQNGEWLTIDLSSMIRHNSALKLALLKSKPGASLNEFYQTQKPKVDKVRVETFGLHGQKNSVSNQVYQYYYEYPVYENEGLGLRFNVPDGFDILVDGSKNPSHEFLVLNNNQRESITFSQLLTESPTTAENEAKAHMKSYLGLTNLIATYEKKPKLWYAHAEKSGAIAMIQGSSIIFIGIKHQRPDALIDFLIRKNLRLKY